MDYYENKEKIEKYIRFTPSHDGAMLVEKLVALLPEGATVLELGVGPGKDFDRLSKKFRVTASDTSSEFLDLFRQRNEQADLIYLDARTLETERTFDCIFSNKVLIHFDREGLRESFVRQHDVLNDDGVILHSLWYGSHEEVFSGLRVYYYTEQDLADLLEGSYDILEVGRHAKISEDDSVYVIARKRAFSTGR